MRNKRRLTAKDAALAVSFTALYTVLSFLPLSQVVGLLSKAITVATIIAPVIGMVLGTYLGGLSAFLGGIIALFVNPYFSPPSLIAGIVSASFAGLLSAGKRGACIFLYFSLLFLFGFYPFIGPVWIYPLLMWFQIAGFLVLVSPLQSAGLKSLGSTDGSTLFLAVLTMALTSTLAGQIAGSVTFEVMSWPVFIADVNVWRAYWQGLTFLYPIERTLIAFAAASIGVPVLRVLRATNMISNKRLERQSVNMSSQ